MQPAEVIRRPPRRMTIEQDVKLFPAIVGPTRLKLDGLIRQTQGERVCGTLTANREDAVQTKADPACEQMFPEKQAELQDLHMYIPTPSEEHNKMIEPEAVIDSHKEAEEREQREPDERHSETETETKEPPNTGHSTEEIDENQVSEAKEKKEQDEIAAAEEQETEGKRERLEKESKETGGTQIVCAEHRCHLIHGKDQANSIKQCSHRTNDATHQKAVVIHPYEPTDTDEMALFVGETVTIFELDGSGWWTGEGGDGRYGLFPSSFVQLLGSSLSSSSPSASSSEQEEEEEEQEAEEQEQEEQKQKGRSKTITKETKARRETKKARSATTSPQPSPSSSKRHTSHSFLSASTRRPSSPALSSSASPTASSSSSTSSSSSRRLTNRLVGNIRRRGSTTKGKASTADNISTLLSSSLDESAPTLFQKEKSCSSSSSSLTPKASSTSTFIASPRGRSFSIRLVAATSAQQPQRRKAKTVGGDKPSVVAPAVRASQPNGGGWMVPQKGHLRPRASTATLLLLLGHHHRNK